MRRPSPTTSNTMRRDPCTSGDDLPAAAAIFSSAVSRARAASGRGAAQRRQRAPAHQPASRVTARSPSRAHGHLRRGTACEDVVHRRTHQPAFGNSGTLGDGWLERYGIDAVVHELNCSWIVGLKDYSSSRHWARLRREPRGGLSRLLRPREARRLLSHVSEYEEGEYREYSATSNAAPGTQRRPNNRTSWTRHYAI